MTLPAKSHLLEPYGDTDAKIKLEAIEELSDRPPAQYVVISAGAGFVYPICGDMRTMPGLSALPAAERIDIDEYGEIVGLS
jgi:formyltetrahydrofolate synthetase